MDKNEIEMNKYIGFDDNFLKKVSMVKFEVIDNDGNLEESPPLIVGYSVSMWGCMGLIGHVLEQMGCVGYATWTQVDEYDSSMVYVDVYGYEDSFYFIIEPFAC